MLATLMYLIVGGGRLQFLPNSYPKMAKFVKKMLKIAV